MVEITEAKISLEDIGTASEILGRNDEHLTYIENALGVRIIVRGEEMLISGESAQVAMAEDIFNQLRSYYQGGNRLSLQEVNYALTSAKAGNMGALARLASEISIATYKGKQIKPKTLGQKFYLEAMKKHDLVFSIGPAGTGKTYLAVVMAIKSLRAKEVQRLVITRPAVEAGEKLGFLPGDLQEKVDPYLRPLYDALYDVLGTENTQKYLERNIIEIAPLAYMRGRTLDDAFIILDEAQNTTVEQMKMFLTRLGFGSKAVITGDITQIDLPQGQLSGLVHARKILSDINNIAFQHLNIEDIVRHPLVQDIIKAYEAAGKGEERSGS